LKRKKNRFVEEVEDTKQHELKLKLDELKNSLETEIQRRDQEMEMKKIEFDLEKNEMKKNYTFQISVLESEKQQIENQSKNSIHQLKLEFQKNQENDMQNLKFNFDLEKKKKLEEKIEEEQNLQHHFEEQRKELIEKFDSEKALLLKELDESKTKDMKSKLEDLTNAFKIEVAKKEEYLERKKK